MKLRCRAVLGAFANRILGFRSGNVAVLRLAGLVPQRGFVACGSFGIARALVLEQIVERTQVVQSRLEFPDPLLICRRFSASHMP